MTLGRFPQLRLSTLLVIPFLVAAVGFNWYLAGARRVMRWLRPLELGAGALLVVMGVLLFTERLTLITAWLTRVFGTGLAL